jgi:hypothetical protein
MTLSPVVAQMGRRKSWLVPTQLLIAAVLLVASAFVDDLILRPVPDVLGLTAIFFLLYLLCATQDIAVDGSGTTACVGLPCRRRAC